MVQKFKQIVYYILKGDPKASTFTSAFELIVEALIGRRRDIRHFIDQTRKYGPKDTNFWYSSYSVIVIPIIVTFYLL